MPCDCAVSPFTTIVPRPFSVVFLFLPVYTSNTDTDTYPLLASALAQTFIPYLIGFMGMYCFRLDLPLNGVIASFMLMFLPGFQTSANWFLSIVIIGAIFPSLLYPSVYCGDRLVLSMKFKYRRRL